MSAAMASTAADWLAAAGAAGLRTDAPRRRIFATAAICHAASGKNMASIEVHDGPNGVWAYCYSCERKVSKELAMAIGQARSGGGRTAGIGQAYTGALDKPGAAAAYLRERLRRPAADAPTADTDAADAPFYDMAQGRLFICQRCGNMRGEYGAHNGAWICRRGTGCAADAPTGARESEASR